VTTLEEKMASMSTTTAVTQPAAPAATATAAATATTVSKREDYISWDDYFMGVAFLSAMRSKDPSTQVGACLVDTENKIVGIGTSGWEGRKKGASEGRGGGEG